MKKLTIILLSTMLITGCNGKQKIDNDTNVQKEKVTSQKEIMQEEVTSQKEIVREKETQSEGILKEEADIIWEAATSREDLRRKLNGTTWETTAPDRLTGLYHKFVISGNNVTEYTAKPTRNYTDSKNWTNMVGWDIHSINEPQQGLYIVALKGKDGTGIYEETPVFLVFKGNLMFYSMMGDESSNTPIKLVSSN